jgi:2-polyprenyl-3-methyl-5-hydroxy-6-metoxy-1,4-benzoquinol methylase
MDYQNKDEGYFKNLRPEMVLLLPNDAKTILDIGCADGSFAKIVKDKNNAEVWGVELMAEEAKKASTKIDKVLAGSIEECIPEIPENYFDVIYLNDILEHLVDPYTIIQKIKKNLSENGVVISSIPNIRYHKSFMKLIFKKQWNYEDHGTLDKTHLRFFTKSSIHNMYTNAGYQVISHKGINASKSLKPWIYNIPVLFSALDIRYLQFATIAKVN